MICPYYGHANTQNFEFEWNVFPIQSILDSRNAYLKVPEYSGTTKYSEKEAANISASNE